MPTCNDPTTFASQSQWPDTIDARPLTDQFDENLLRRAAGPYMRVMRIGLSMR
jgi:hypothetical protein